VELYNSFASITESSIPKIVAKGGGGRKTSGREGPCSGNSLHTVCISCPMCFCWTPAYPTLGGRMAESPVSSVLSP